MTGMSDKKGRSSPRKGRLEFERGLGDARPFIQLVLAFLHRTDHHRRAVYLDDLDLARVGETIGLASVETEARKPEFREKFGDYQNQIGVEGQRPIKALTISEATGIPRETVRRKLKILLEHGVIVEKAPGGYVLKPGFMQKPETMELVDRGMRDTLQFMNDCVKLGFVRWVDEAE